MYNEYLRTSTVSEPIEWLPSRVSIKPFLKWAGGKTQLISKLSKYVPLDYNKYIEPFVGGGAFFFHLNPEKAIISDSNEELIITSTSVRDNAEELIQILEGYKNDKSFFYQIRALNPQNLSEIERAARLIYLNKACFNGLYRVNKQGQFNVPYGERNREFLNRELLLDSSKFLQTTKILHADYLETLNKFAEKGDFIFLDPPYYPVGKY